MFVVVTGCQWRQIPKDLVHWKTAYNYFRKWSKDKIWHLIELELNQKVRINMGRKPKPSVLIIDSQSTGNIDIQNKLHSGYDGHKKVKGVKRFILTDTQGLTWNIKLLPANTGERYGAKLLIEEFLKRNPASKNIHTIVSDKGFSGRALQEYFTNNYNVKFQSMIPIYKIKSTPNKQFEEVNQQQITYKQTITQYINRNISKIRWVVERTFAWFLQYRRLTRNYEKLFFTAEAMARLAMIRLKLKRLSKTD